MNIRIVTSFKKLTHFFSKYSFFISSIVIAIYLSTKPPLIGEDGLTYITFDSIRPPLYPTFLWLFHRLDSYQYVVVIWIQFVISFLALWYAKKCLETKMNISKNLIFFIIASTSGLIFVYYQMLETICSEALTFPIFIITFFYFIESFNEFSVKRIIILSFFTSLLVLTRAQFYYFYLNLFVLLVWQMKRKVQVKKIFISTLIIIVSILTTEGINRNYHYFMNGKFSNIPAIGLQLLPQAIYLSDESMSKYFKNRQEQILFKKMLTKLELNHLTKQSAPSVIKGIRAEYAYFSASVPAIENNYYEFLKDIKQFERDQLLFDISKTLYFHNMKNNIKFYLWKITSYFGEIIFFIFFISVLFSMCQFFFSTKELSIRLDEIFITISMLTILLNISFVAIWVHILPSYSYYNYFLIFCISAIIIQRIKSKSNQSHLAYS